MLRSHFGIEELLDSNPIQELHFRGCTTLNDEKFTFIKKLKNLRYFNSKEIQSWLNFCDDQKVFVVQYHESGHFIGGRCQNMHKFAEFELVQSLEGERNELKRHGIIYKETFIIFFDQLTIIFSLCYAVKRSTILCNGERIEPRIEVPEFEIVYGNKVTREWSLNNHISDNGLLPLLERCKCLSHIDLSKLDKITDASVIKLAENCTTNIVGK